MTLHLFRPNTTRFFPINRKMNGDDAERLEDNVGDDAKRLEDVNRNVCAKSGMPEAHRACAQSKRE